MREVNSTLSRSEVYPDATFSATVQPWLGHLRRFCTWRAHDLWDAEELVQETLTKAFVAHQQHGAPLSLSYLFKVAQNTWIDTRRRKALDCVPLDAVRSLASADVPSGEARDALCTLAGQLPVRQQCVFVLREVFQFTAPEIAEATGMTEGAVKAALARARDTLRHANMELDGDTAAADDPDEQVVSAYLGAIRDENPQLFLELLARLQMGDNAAPHMVQLHALQQIHARRRTQGVHPVPHTTVRALAA